MKAIVARRYGTPDVLEYTEVSQPVPQADQVLLQVRAASVNAYDWHLLTADIFLVRLAAGMWKPKRPVIGADVAGRVAAVGANCTRFQPGDEVYGDIGAGSFAEFACAKEKQLALKPAGLSFEEAAATPMAALTALQALRDHGGLQPGQRVLIQGASGGVGSFAVQIAKQLGGEVSAVCSTRNVTLARSLGADHVIDYTREDFTRGRQTYDLILAVNGYHSIFDYRRALKPSGVYVMAGGKVGQLFEALLLGRALSRPGGQKLGAMTAVVRQADLELIKAWIEAGKIKPVIDRSYPLREAAEALRYLGRGHARGKVVISIPG